MPGDTQLRILFINHWAARLGGAEHSLLDIIAEAVRRHQAATVFLVTSEEGELVRRASALGVVCRVVPCAPSVAAVRRSGLIRSALHEWRGILSFLLYVLHVRRYVGSISPHCIHANVPKSHITLSLLALMGFRGACCYHVREIFERNSAPYLLYAALMRRKNALVLAISKAALAALPLRLQKIAVVEYNGVSIPPAAHRPSPQRGLPPRFIYLGRVVPWKGCHLLVKAFAMLRDRRGKDAGTLDIIGDTLYWDPSYREELANTITELKLGTVCRLLPHTDRPIEVFYDHDVFCIASDREPFGRVVAEAHGCGLPVIGFCDGALPEIVEQGVTGLLVTPGEVAAFAAAMETFVDNKENAAAMGHAARRRAERFFNGAVQTGKIMDRIEEKTRSVSGELKM